MLESLAQSAEPILNLPYVLRTRRNHGLEHATIHILSSRVQGLRMAGRSDDSGFTLIGEVKTEEVERAVAEALIRMIKGEHSLAVHPNCGTNLATTGAMVSLAALAGAIGIKRGAQDYINRLPMVMVLMMVTVLFSQPLGMALQRYFTTDGDPADLEVVSITRSTMHMPFGGATTMHRVVTRST